MAVPLDFSHRATTGVTQVGTPLTVLTPPAVETKAEDILSKEEQATFYDVIGGCNEELSSTTSATTGG